MAELADKAQVSLGQVSNVRRALIDREWATAEAGEGLRLTQPDALLDAWRDDGLHPPSIALRGCPSYCLVILTTQNCIAGSQHTSITDGTHACTAR